MVIILFSIKVIAGFVIGWMSQEYYPEGNDYWNINRHAWEEYQVLMNDPVTFFSDIFNSPYPEKYSGFFSSVGSWWNDLANNLIIKFIALCNLITRGNYYLNSLVFNFLVFFGHIALYRVFINICNSKWAVIAACFLIPSTLYFTSGIHKDGVVFTLLALFCFALYLAKQGGFKPKYLLILFISSAGILLMRNYVFFAMIPAAIALLLAYKYTRPIKWFALVYSVLFISIITTSFISDKGVIPLVAQKQKDFFDLPVASTQIKMDTLQPTLKSLLLNTPAAVERGFLRPYVWEFPGSFLMPIAIELLVFLLLFLYMLLRRGRLRIPADPLVLFGVFLAATVILFAGYVVPNAGSLVRYRSLYLPFLMFPVFCLITFKSYYK